MVSTIIDPISITSENLEAKSIANFIPSSVINIGPILKSPLPECTTRRLNNPENTNIAINMCNDKNNFIGDILARNIRASVDSARIPS